MCIIFWSIVNSGVTFKPSSYVFASMANVHDQLEPIVKYANISQMCGFLSFLNDWISLGMEQLSIWR